MDEQPENPAQETRELLATNIDDAREAAYGGHIPFVDVLKSLLVFFPGRSINDDRSHIISLLHGSRSHTRNRGTIFLSHTSRIANHKDVCMTRDTQVTVYLNSACTICLSSKPFTRW